MYGDILKQMQDAVRKAAKILPNEFVNGKITDKEGKANYVTEYDFLVQKSLFQSLKKICPQATMLGEEDIGEQNKLGEYSFIVDPIDGTMNFARNMRMSTICVAYAEQADIKAGVVYNPYSNEMFTAAKGEGAKLNGKKISVSDKSLEQAIVFVGAAPYYEEMIGKTFRIAENFLRVGHDIRRSGTAAYDMCCVACGRGEVMFEAVLSPWDFSAAKIIVEEAGGKVTDMDGGELKPIRSSVLATNKFVHKQALDIVSKCLEEE